jgi:hypothetical protein
MCARSERIHFCIAAFSCGAFRKEDRRSHYARSFFLKLDASKLVWPRANTHLQRCATLALFFGAPLLDRNRERIIFSGGLIRQARTRILHQFIARPQSHKLAAFSQLPCPKSANLPVLYSPPPYL